MTKQNLRVFLGALSSVFWIVALVSWVVGWYSAFQFEYFFFSGFPEYLSPSLGFEGFLASTGLYLALPVVTATVLRLIADEFEDSTEEMPVGNVVALSLPFILFVFIVSLLAAAPLWLVWTVLGAGLYFCWLFILLVVGIVQLIFSGDWDSLAGIIVAVLIVVALFAGGDRVVGFIFFFKE